MVCKEKPLQEEAHALQLESWPHSPQLEKSPHSNEDTAQPKIKLMNLKKKKKSLY